MGRGVVGAHLDPPRERLDRAVEVRVGDEGAPPQLVDALLAEDGRHRRRGRKRAGGVPVAARSLVQAAELEVRLRRHRDRGQGVAEGLFRHRGSAGRGERSSERESRTLVGRIEPDGVLQLSDGVVVAIVGTESEGQQPARLCGIGCGGHRRLELRERGAQLPRA